MNEPDDNGHNGHNGISSVALQSATQETSSHGSSRALALHSPRSLDVCAIEEARAVKGKNGRLFRHRRDPNIAPCEWNSSQLLYGVLLGVSVSLLAYSLGIKKKDTGTLRYMGSEPWETWQDSPRQMLHMHETAFVGKDWDGHVDSVGVESIAFAEVFQSSRNFVVVKVGSEEAGLLDIHPAQEVALCHLKEDLRIAVVARPLRFTRNYDKNLATVWVFDPEMGRFDDYLGVKRTGVKFVSNTPSLGSTADHYNANGTSGRSSPLESRT